MMPNRRKQRPFTTQVTLSVLAGALFALAMMAAFGFYAVLRVDRAALQRERSFVGTGIADRMETLATEQRSVTVWDDSVANAKAGNTDWLRDNLGEWMNFYYGHDLVYILNDKDQPVYAMEDGATLPPATFEKDAAVLLPSVNRLRAAVAASAPEPGIAEFVRLNGVPTIVSVQPIVSDSETAPQQPQGQYIHISVERIKDAIGKIAKRYELQDLQFVEDDPHSPASVPLADSGGTPIGYLTWQPNRPGLELIKRAAPALLGGTTLTLGLLILLLRRLRRASHALESSEHGAQFLAYHDTLTRLPNRALFEDRLAQALATVRRGSSKVALLCVDIDRFKELNDTLGHPAGDMLLRQVAARLVDAVREVDTVARIGGDEFAILLVDVHDLRKAEAVCDRVIEDVCEPFDLLGEQVFVRVSIGLALSPEFGTDPAELMRKADIALYESKRSGRGRYCVFAGGMDDLLKHKRAIEHDLRLALEAGDQINLVYQPVLGLAQDALAGAEAMLEWHHGAGRNLPVTQLIAIAEERGLIGRLTRRVLRLACTFVSENDIPWMQIALSPVFLRHEGAARIVLDILAEKNVEPKRLQVEIGESVLLEANGPALQAINTLRAMGTVIVLDDFGSGPSSITMLRQRPVDKLKIDRSFVRALGSADPAAAIVKAITELANAIGIEVAAEGVETADQKRMLAALGCREIQGPVVSEPLTGMQLAELFRNNRSMKRTGPQAASKLRKHL